MADNWTHASELLPFSCKEEEEFVTLLLAVIDKHDSQEKMTHDESALYAILRDDIDWETISTYGSPAGAYVVESDDGLWISDDAGVLDLELMSDILQVIMKKFHDGEGFIFEYAFTCSKPRLGEFGGGALLVSSEEKVWFSPWLEAKDKANELRLNRI